MEYECIGTLVAGNLLSIGSEIDLQDKSDILDSLLFTQLHADTLANRFDATAQWLSDHGKAMQQLKWSTLNYQGDTFEPEGDSSISIATLIEHRLMDSLPREQADALRKLINCVAGAGSPEAVSILFRQRALQLAETATGHSAIVLQVSALTQPTQLSSLFVRLMTTQAVEPDPFHQAFSANAIVGAVEVHGFQRSWSRSEYQKVRGYVGRFLADKGRGLILPVRCEVSAGDGGG